MPHRNAPLSETGRLRLARCVVEDGWPLRAAAERFGVSHTTAKRWADRYRQQGAAGMVDRPSRPHRSPTRTPAEVEERIVALRRAHKIGPVRIAARVGVAPSTVHRVLVRRGLPRLDCCDRATGEPIRRYERRAPGELVHVDVKKLARIPDGGGHRVLGRAEGRKNRGGYGYAFIHTALDDYSRLAYSEILTDEKAGTCAGFLTRAVAWFAAHGVTVERVLTDNAWAYTKTTWRTTCARLGIRPDYTRPWRPQTNGKVERFHRTLAEEWAYHQPYPSEAARRAVFGDWLDWYNYHRPHTALGGHPPATRVTNLSEQHT
ncbi:transposase [Carbonactinospora thermoautotrophica]|uniref:Transposase n=2 Tax=Carbonactinospora thermoautotrophica TaxID=1469144 RepID=A0A132N0Q6_9ACTN|nr:IS481 family transposase [Carbonactinospora thermoautotrophica]KWX03654.1 transposase [Carbonactinospora thermoautotrophica]